MPDDPREPLLVPEPPESPEVEADAAVDLPAAALVPPLPMGSSGPPADWLEKVRRHAPGLLLGGPPMRSAMPDSYPSGVAAVDFDDPHARGAEPQAVQWRFDDAEPARQEERQPLGFGEPASPSRTWDDPDASTVFYPPVETAAVPIEPINFSGTAPRAADPPTDVDLPTWPPVHRQPMASDVTDEAPGTGHPTANFGDNQLRAARAALSGAGPLNETPSTPERRAEPWPDTSQDGDVNSDGPARRRVPRIVAMSRPIRPAGIEWPLPQRSAHRQRAVTWSPAARLPEPPAAFGVAGEIRDPWPTLPADPPPDVFEVSAALRERERRARLFREQEGA